MTHRTLNILFGLLCLSATAAVSAEPAPALTDEPLAADTSVLNADSLVEESLQYVTASELKDHLQPKKLRLKSTGVLVLDERDKVLLYERHADKARPIASITKLMTAMVVLDANLPMDEPITIVAEDRDNLRRSRSRLPYGTELTRSDMLLMALAASENRAAKALARTYPGGTDAFVEAMNAKAKELGLEQTRFMDPAGLHQKNVSSPLDLAVLMEAAYEYPLIREMSTSDRSELVDLQTGRAINFVNTNRLIRSDDWNIDLSKTGFINEAGFCLVMRATVAERPIAIILLNSWGKMSKYGDANRIRSWLMQTEQRLLNMKSKVAGIEKL